MAEQTWVDNLATPEADPDAEPGEFTLGKSEVDGLDKVADGPGVPIAGILILLACIFYLAGQALYGRKSTDEEPK